MSVHEECALVKRQNSFVLSYYHVFDKRLKDQQNLRRKVILAREEEEFCLNVMQYFLHVIFLYRAGLACVRH